MIDPLVFWGTIAAFIVLAIIPATILIWAMIRPTGRRK